MLFRNFAASLPSELKTSVRNPPPGQTMAAAPVAISLGGRKTVSEGLWIFFTHQSFASSFSFFLFSKPGAPFDHKGITSALSCAKEERGTKTKTIKKIRIDIIFFRLLPKKYLHINDSEMQDR